MDKYFNAAREAAQKAGRMLKENIDVPREIFLKVRLISSQTLILSPWDVAAGALIAREAGGRISDFQNGGFRIFGSEALATNSLIHQQMVDVLQLGKQKEVR